MQKVNVSDFMSDLASALNKQDIFMRTINVNLSDNNTIRIEIEGVLNETENKTNK